MAGGFVPGPAGALLVADHRRTDAYVFPAGAPMGALLAVVGEEATLGLGLFFADVLQPLDAHVGDLQQDAAVFAKHVDGRCPFGHLAVSAIIEVGAVRQPAADIGVSLAHPQPISRLAMRAKVIGSVGHELRGEINQPLRGGAFDWSARDRLPAFQDGAHHRRREQDGAFFGLAHGVTSRRAH